jgi:hypothetical protein
MPRTLPDRLALGQTPSSSCGSTLRVDRAQCSVIKVLSRRSALGLRHYAATHYAEALKAEDASGKAYATQQDAGRQIGAVIETVYKAKRLQSAHGYGPPVAFEAEPRAAIQPLTTDEALSVD